MLRMNETARVGDRDGCKKTFAPFRLTLGEYFPIEASEGDEPTMPHQEQLARPAPEAGCVTFATRSPHP